MLNNMKGEWKTVDFEIVPHKKEFHKIKTWEDICNLLDDHIINT